MALTKADLEIAEEYARLCDHPRYHDDLPYDRGRIRAYGSGVKRVAQIENLLEDTRPLALSLSRRAPTSTPSTTSRCGC